MPDVEVYTAVLPGLARTDGMLVAISTPYRKLGLLYQKHRDCFGDDNDDVLVVRGASKVFNPTLSDATIAAQRAADPTGSAAEWDAVFRDDLSSFLDDQSIDAAVDHGRPLELPPREGVLYHTFVDMGGGRHDPRQSASSMLSARVTRAAMSPMWFAVGTVIRARRCESSWSLRSSIVAPSSLATTIRPSGLPVPVARTAASTGKRRACEANCT